MTDHPAPRHLPRQWRPRPRRQSPRHGSDGRPGRRRHLHPRELLRAVPAHRRRARAGDASLAGAGRRACAGHRHHLAFLDPHRRPAREGRGRCRRQDADDDAALSRRAAQGRRAGHGRAFQAGGGCLRHPDHPAGCAALGRDADRALHGQAGEGGAARPLLQDRGARHRQQAARADRGRRRGSRRPLRRRGGDHADGRSRRRRDRHDDVGHDPRSDQADPRQPSCGRRPQAGQAALYARKCCRSSTTRTANAACARPRR